MLQSKWREPVFTYPVRDFYQNQVIFSEGTGGNVAYILRAGEVQISTTAAEEDVALAVLRPPAVFGEMALLLEGHTRTATARALEHCQVVEISRSAFQDYIGQSPSVIASVLQAMADRLDATTRRATRVPDLFMGVCHVLHLFRIHADTDLQYGRTIEALAEAFLVEAKQVEALIKRLSDVGLVEMRQGRGGPEAVCLPTTKDFLGQASKISRGLRSLG
jgi:CRP/FNR family cyclic AMP-dependent transcriptional regulator